MKVRIAFVTDVDGNIDTNRVGSIEDHPDADAQRLIREGIAAVPTEDELADWDAEVERRTAAEAADLSGLTVKQLRDQYPAAANMPANTKKDDLIAAVEEARRVELAGGTSDGGQPDDNAADDTATGDAEPTGTTTDEQ